MKVGKIYVNRNDIVYKLNAYVLEYDMRMYLCTQYAKTFLVDRLLADKQIREIYPKKGF